MQNTYQVEMDLIKKLLASVLLTSTTKSFVATLFCTDIFDRDALNNTYNQTLDYHTNTNTTTIRSNQRMC